MKKPAGTAHIQNKRRVTNAKRGRINKAVDPAAVERRQIRGLAESVATRTHSRRIGWRVPSHVRVKGVIPEAWEILAVHRNHITIRWAFVNRSSTQVVCE